MTNKKIYEIMHMDRKVASVSETGKCKIYFKSFMPYNLYLEEQEDIDTLVNAEVKENVFSELPQFYDMFLSRLTALKGIL